MVTVDFDMNGGTSASCLVAHVTRIITSLVQRNGAEDQEAHLW